MATVQNLRPNGTPTFGSNWAIFGPGPPATAHQATSDNNSLTGVQANVADSVGNDQVIFALTTYALQANERVNRVRLRSLGYGRHAHSWCYSYLRSGGVDTSPTPMNNGVDLAQYFYTPWFSTDPNTGLEWAQAGIDALQAKYRHDSIGGSPHSEVDDLWVEVEVIRQAAATIINPIPDGVSRDKASIQWSYNGNGEPQESWRVKVFTQAIAEAGGFDPETEATIAFDSGVMDGSSTQTVVQNTFGGAVLTPGDTYYAYVKVSKLFQGVVWWGAWSGQRFTVDEGPVTNVTGPADPVTNASRPTVTFTYTDPTGGSPKLWHEMMVFAQPGGGWVGFDPIVSAATAVYTAIGGNGSLSEQIGVDLVNGTTYRAYVRSQQNGAPQGLENLWGDFDFQQFTLSLTPPDPPLLTATPVVATASVTLQLTHQDGAGPTPEYYQIERTDDQGLSGWTLVRGCEQIPHVAHGTVQTYNDYECPFYNTGVRYRARSVDTSLGQPVSRLSTEQAPVLQVKNVWIKVPSSALFNFRPRVVDSWVNYTRSKIRSKKSPLGRTKPILISGVEDAVNFSTTFLLIGEFERNLFRFVFGSNNAVLYQTAKRNIWVQLAADTNESDHLWDELHGEDGVCQITVTFQEVEAPTDV